ncbi:MAG: pyruvate oxidase [Gammaproteobacteria bacterium]|nr:pyruvate oxidase [Gammaproteobacteria bacterium]
MSADLKFNPWRRKLLQLAGATGTGLAAADIFATQAALSFGQQRSPLKDTPMSSDPTLNTADLLIETLIAWDVPFVFGLVGDGINSITEALRKRQDRIRFITVRHEEAAAFMACGYAKHTGKLGVCLATTGPGAVHLLNGLYDAKMDSAPVLAITGTTFHDLIGTSFMQGVDTISLMRDVALYNVQVTGPLHARIVGNVACRAALSGRGVAHLSVAKDTQSMALSADKPSMENHGLQTSARWEPPQDVPSPDRLREAAAVLNAGRRIAILAGQGALGARAEVIQAADKLGAPVAKALLGKAVLPDDSPYTTGGIGHLGTVPSQQSMQECDTLLILGSTMPWIDSYPKPGQARAVQVDLNGSRIGLRYPVEVGLVGDVKATLTALLPLLDRKADRTFLSSAQSRMREWNTLLTKVAQTKRSPLRPQMVVRQLGDALAADAIISLDCGANTHFAARILQLRENQRLTGTGLLATMGPGLSYAIAAQLAFPQRQSVAIVGDGGFAQLMAEFATAVKYQLPVKVLVLSNRSLAEVRFEQEELGNPNFGCDLSPIDFAAYAKACGAAGFRCTTPDELGAAVRSFLSTPGPAILDAVVDANEKPALPDELKV